MLKIQRMRYGAASAQMYKIGLFRKEETGLIQIRHDMGNTYRIQQFMTITTQRRKGIGRKLLKAMVKEIRRNGVTTIIVYPCPESYSNEDMVAIEELYAIYKKMGFAFVDENADISKCNQKMYMTIS